MSLFFNCTHDVQPIRGVVSLMSSRPGLLHACAIVILHESPGNIFQCNFNQSTQTFIKENEYQNVARKMVSILPRPQCVKS